MKNKRKKKIHRNKNGREFIKNTYFVGGKMKHDRIYLIDGIPENEFYEKNATDLDFFINGDYELMRSEIDSNSHCDEQIRKESDLPDNEEAKDLPF
ncbi:MAG: hypothetical protein JXA77_07665 [Bacteroidales bacterium]|nr:hypothetical protein [Bacteroidales bacterium]MBN2817866.1 hypothetical protein [Bacteroidales bacterium]